MKKATLFFLLIALADLTLTGCEGRTQPTTTPAVVIESTEIFTATATTKPTATFLPIFTLAPILPYSFPTRTLTPIPKDIFDNFQGLSGNCRTADGLDSLMVASYDLNGGTHITSMADAHISFDRDSYFSGDSIKLSASANSAHNYSKLMTGIVMKVVVEDPMSNRYSFYLYDTKTHKDEKPDDGIYVNTFDKTSSTGIYKFYFQLFGRDKNTGETIAKECFLAKTVSPIPTPTPALSQADENKSCRKLEPSDPVVVRPEGVGGSDRYDTSRLAFFPKAVSTNAGVLTVWKVDQHAYMRLFDADFNPLSEVESLFERPSRDFQLVKQDDSLVLTYCGLYDIGHSIFDLRHASALIDSSGNLISEQVRSPNNISCGGGVPSVWTGSRLLFLSWNNTFTNSVQELGHFETFLDIADKDGNSISWRNVTGFDSLSAVGHGNVLIGATRNWGSSLVIHRLDLEGNDLGELTTLEALTYEVDGKVVVGAFRDTYIVPTADGWMVVASLYAPGIYIARLALDGSLISDPVIMEKDLYFVNGLEDVFAYKGGAVILGGSSPFGYSTKTGSATLFISGNETITQWYPKEGEQPIFGSFFEHQGRLFLIYTSEFTDETPANNQVLIRELQCVP